VFPRFLSQSRRYFLKQKSFEKYRKSVDKDFMATAPALIFTIVWTSVLVWPLFFHPEILKVIGVHNKDDIAYYFLISGVILYGIYTATGFILLIKMFIALKSLMRYAMRIDTYSGDGIGGFEFTVTFARKTNWLFATGILFVPLLAVLSKSYSGDASGIVSISIWIYSGVLISSSYTPIIFIHYIIKKFKRIHILRIKHRTSDIYKMLMSPNFCKTDHNMQYYINKLRDVANINEWPTGFGKYIIPMIVSLIPKIIELVIKSNS
jgi:hypothetical protein